MGKHHGSEGRKGIKIAPKNLPNVTSGTFIEKDDVRYFFLRAAAAAGAGVGGGGGGAAAAAPGWENTMAVKDGKASELRPKKCLM